MSEGLKRRYSYLQKFSVWIFCCYVKAPERAFIKNLFYFFKEKEKEKETEGKLLFYYRIYHVETLWVLLLILYEVNVYFAI